MSFDSYDDVIVVNSSDESDDDGKLRSVSISQKESPLHPSIGIITAHDKKSVNKVGFLDECVGFKASERSHEIVTSTAPSSIAVRAHMEFDTDKSSKNSDRGVIYLSKNDYNEKENEKNHNVQTMNYYEVKDKVIFHLRGLYACHTIYHLEPEEQKILNQTSVEVIIVDKSEMFSTITIQNCELNLRICLSHCSFRRYTKLFLTKVVHNTAEKLAEFKTSESHPDQVCCKFLLKLVSGSPHLVDWSHNGCVATSIQSHSSIVSGVTPVLTLWGGDHGRYVNDALTTTSTATSTDVAITTTESVDITRASDSNLETFINSDSNHRDRMRDYLYQIMEFSEPGFDNVTQQFSKLEEEKNNDSGTSVSSSRINSKSDDQNIKKRKREASFIIGGKRVYRIHLDIVLKASEICVGCNASEL